MRDELSPKEWLQLELEGVHREAQRQDEQDRAANRAVAIHRWPRLAAWIVQQRELAFQRTA